MIFDLLHIDIQEFIHKNTISDVTKLAFQKNPFPNHDWKLILQQIEAKAKAKHKLPTWFATQNILYPSKISVEQTSSEKTAAFKASLISGESLIDLTGGFGVDGFYFSKNIKKVVHCEINEALSPIVAHNFRQLKAENISCFAGDGLSILKKLDQHWNWIYIDPSRRNDAKGKVFMLADCLPNVPENLDFLLNYTSNILIKTAPLLDISAGLLELKNVKTVHIVALDNEVKELLWEIEKNYTQKTRIKTINIGKDKTAQFEFDLNDKTPQADYELPNNYLYEPNAAIMKSGGFDAVTLQYNLSKLHKHSHLYTNSVLIEFPGRSFEIEKVIAYSKPEMKANFENQHFNISTRNFPDTVENIRKKWKIKDGGTQYCFFTTDKNDAKIALICKKI